MSARLLLASPPLWVAVIVAAEWALSRRRTPSPLAELLEGDVS